MLVAVKVAVLVAVAVKVAVGSSVPVGVRLAVGVAVDVTYSASTERKSTWPPDALTDQSLQPAGTLRMKLLKPASELAGFAKSVVLLELQALTVTLPTPVPSH